MSRTIEERDIEEEFGALADETKRVDGLQQMLQQLFTVPVQLTEGESHELVMNCQKNPCEAWRRLQRRFDPVTGGRKRNLLRMIINPGRSSLQDLQCSMERWEGFMVEEVVLFESHLGAAGADYARAAVYPLRD